MCNIALMRNILSGKPRFCGGRPFFLILKNLKKARGKK